MGITAGSKAKKGYLSLSNFDTIIQRHTEMPERKALFPNHNTITILILYINMNYIFCVFWRKYTL